MASWTLEEIAIEAIEVHDQVREISADAPDIRALAANIRAQGLRQPLTAYREQESVVLVFGHRRLAASVVAGRKAVPVLVHQGPLDRGSVLKAQLAENLNRIDLSPIEEAQGYVDLMQVTGMTARDVSREYGRSEAHVSKLTKLLALPVPIQEMLRQQAIPWSAGYELSQVGDEQEQLRLASELVEGKLTRDALRGSIRRATQKDSAQRTRASGRAVAELERGQSITVTGSDLTIDSVIETVEQYLARLRKARTKGWSLSTTLRALKDQSRSN
jgi:ParB family chromosome partitioning protein